MSLGALLWLYLTSRLNATEFGDLNYDIAIATIMTAVGTLGFDTTLTTFVAKGTTRMIYEATFLTLLTSIILSVTIFMFFSSLSVVILLIGMLFYTLIDSEYLGKHEFKKYMYIRVAQRLITLVSVPLLYEMFSLEGAVYGFAFSYIAFSYLFFNRLRKIRISVSTLVPIRGFFINSYILGLSRILPYFLDKLIIAPLFGLAIVGYYQFGVQLLTLTSIIPVISYSVYLTKSSKR